MILEDGDPEQRVAKAIGKELKQGSEESKGSSKNSAASAAAFPAPGEEEE